MTKYIDKNGEFTHIKLVNSDGSEEFISKQDAVDLMWVRIRKSNIKFDTMTTGIVTFDLPLRYRKMEDLNNED